MLKEWLDLWRGVVHAGKWRGTDPAVGCDAQCGGVAGWVLYSDVKKKERDWAERDRALVVAGRTGVHASWLGNSQSFCLRGVKLAVRAGEKPDHVGG